MTALHPYAAYWDQGVMNVPDMTGAKHLLDGRDLQSVFASLGMPARLSNVLDVGCGTGRMAQFCDGYTGVDIAPSMVNYCRNSGIEASVIAGPQDLDGGGIGLGFEWVTCISVFTHIPRAERLMYLNEFYRIAENVLVDIIAGDGAGDVALWTAAPDSFEEDCQAVGFQVVGVVNHQWDLHVHRYYRLQRVA